MWFQRWDVLKKLIAECLGTFWLAFSASVSLVLAQWDGNTARNTHSENLFFLRWLQMALKQKRFHRCVAGDLAWLINLGQQRVMTAKLKSRLEYLWR